MHDCLLFIFHNFHFLLLQFFVLKEERERGGGAVTLPIWHIKPMIKHNNSSNDNVHLQFNKHFCSTVRGVEHIMNFMRHCFPPHCVCTLLLPVSPLLLLVVAAVVAGAVGCQ